MDKPLISILMGVFYRKPDITLLRRSVDSLLAQTVGDFELLICDDGSSPEAVEYLNGAAAADERIRLIRRGDLFSLPVKLNACLQAARGDYIARMDDDDYSYPARFERQLAFLDAHPEIAFVGCSVELWREGTVGERLLPEYPTVRDFYFVQPFIHPSLLFRRTALETVNGYSEDKHCILCEDYDMLLRLYAAGLTGANLPEKLLAYTVPLTARGNRKMRHRWNESVTRYRRFRELGCLPGALPWVVKPLAVGVLPEGLLKKLKKG